MVIAPSPPPHPGNQSSVSREGQNERTTVLLQHIKMLSTAPAERATLFALMNHLKRVAMHHHQNKMTCQNLAVCFGPVLLGPINAGQVNGWVGHPCLTVTVEAEVNDWLAPWNSGIWDFSYKLWLIYLSWTLCSEFVLFCISGLISMPR